jgi:peptidoglycan/LPS O-acetylase OafA/YrhL
MRKQIHLEAIRGLAAFIVVAAHFAAAFYPSTVFGGTYPLHERWESLFTTTPLGIVFASHFAVCVFFVLSGYVLSLPYFGDASKDTSNLLAALLKRPFRLAGLVLASVLTSFCIFRFACYFNAPVSIRSYSIPWFQDWWSQDTLTFKRLIWDVTTGMFATGSRYNPPLWTLQIELYGSFLTFIFLLLFRKSNLRLLAYIYAFGLLHDTLYHGILIGIFLADIVRNHPRMVENLSRSTVAFPLLAVGLLLSSYPAYIVAPTEMANTFYGTFPSLPGLGGGYSMLGATIVFASVLISPHLQNKLSRRPFAFLGRISYAVYAFHFLLLGSFTSWLFLNLSPNLTYNKNCAVVGVVSLTILVVLSYLLTKYVDEPVTYAANRLANIWLQSTHAVTPLDKMFADVYIATTGLTKRCSERLRTVMRRAFCVRRLAVICSRLLRAGRWARRTPALRRR